MDKKPTTKPVESYDGAMGWLLRRVKQNGIPFDKDPMTAVHRIYEDDLQRAINLGWVEPDGDPRYKLTPAGEFALERMPADLWKSIKDAPRDGNVIEIEGTEAPGTYRYSDGEWLTALSGFQRSVGQMRSGRHLPDTDNLRWRLP